MKCGKAIAILLLFLMVIGMTVLIMLPVRAATLDTYHAGWKLIRETATEDGATFAAVYDLAGAEGNFASKDSSSVEDGGPYRIRSVAGTGDGNEFQTVGAAWEFVISGGVEDNDTFSFNLIGWSRINGMLQVICEGNGIIGTQDVVLYPDDGATATSIWWADTITLDETTKWNTVEVLNSGDNEVAVIHVDTAGLEWVQFVIYDAGGTGTESNNLTVFGRPY